MGKVLAVIDMTLTRAYLRSGLKFTALKYSQKLQQRFKSVGNDHLRVYHLTCQECVSQYGPIYAVLGLGTLCDLNIVLGRWNEFLSVLKYSIINFN